MGRVMGWMWLIASLANMLAPPLFGWVRDETGSYDGVLILYTVLSGLTLFALPRMRVGAPTRDVGIAAAA
jgi:cyanate permease